MAKAEWTKYFALSDDGVFWGLEQYKDKLPQSPEEEVLLKKAGIMAIFTDTGNHMVWDCIQKRWY